MSDVMTPVPADHPLKVGWDAWAETSDYGNTKRWATDDSHVRGSLWEAFRRGFEAGKEASANLHEDINPASDVERLNGDPGAGAMGAVIEYRDKIRSL